MLPQKYLVGLDAEDGDIRGIYGVRHATVPGSWRILCSYDDGQRNKERLFANLAAHGQVESRRTWELHHIVERQHFADVDFAGVLPRLYATELPCVLITHDEHVLYNGLLHIRETDDLFRNPALPRQVAERSKAVAAAARNRANHPKLRADAENLLRLYRNAYSGDPVLTTVAVNVLKEALTSLR